MKFQFSILNSFELLHTLTTLNMLSLSKIQKKTKKIWLPEIFPLNNPKVMSDLPSHPVVWAISPLPFAVWASVLFFWVTVNVFSVLDGRLSYYFNLIFFLIYLFNACCLYSMKVITDTLDNRHISKNMCLIITFTGHMQHKLHPLKLPSINNQPQDK